MTVTIDDLETDFDAALTQMVKEVEAEIAAIPEEQRERYFAHSAVNHLARLLLIDDCPVCLLEHAWDRVHRRIPSYVSSKRLATPRPCE